MIITIRARLRSLWMNGSGSFRFLMTDTAYEHLAGKDSYAGRYIGRLKNTDLDLGLYDIYDDRSAEHTTMTIAGIRLSSNSNASLELVVTKLRNISTAMMDCPKRYNNTIWNAPKNKKGNNIQKVLPQFLDQLITI